MKTSIPWTHYTFNAWWGCSKISEGCKNCYASAFAKRTGHDVWGDEAPRRTFENDEHWDEPLKWNADADEAGERRRVFCSSMADVFEGGRPELAPYRQRLWRLIENTPQLDWLLLTKRPQNILHLLSTDALAVGSPFLGMWLEGKPPANVWVGTTVENQARAEERIPVLAHVPAVVRFLSLEPLLEEVRLLGIDGIAETDWWIVGGESGGGSRGFDLAWARTLRAESNPAGAAFFMKQIGAKPFETTTKKASAASAGALPGGGRFSFKIVEAEMTSTATWKPVDAKGESFADIPEDLRLRNFPRVRHAQR